MPPTLAQGIMALPDDLQKMQLLALSVVALNPATKYGESMRQAVQALSGAPYDGPSSAGWELAMLPSAGQVKVALLAAMMLAKNAHKEVAILMSCLDAFGNYKASRPAHHDVADLIDIAIENGLDPIHRIDSVDGQKRQIKTTDFKTKHAQQKAEREATMGPLSFRAQKKADRDAAFKKRRQDKETMRSLSRAMKAKGSLSYGGAQNNENRPPTIHATLPDGSKAPSVDVGKVKAADAAAGGPGAGGGGADLEMADA